MQNSLLHAQAYQANSAGKLSSGSITSLRTVFAHKGVVLQTLIREEISSARETGERVRVCALVFVRAYAYVQSTFNYRMILI